MLGLFIVRYLISVSKHIPDLFSIVVHELKHVEAMLNPCESSPGFKKLQLLGWGVGVVQEKLLWPGWCSATGKLRIPSLLQSGSA